MHTQTSTRRGSGAHGGGLSYAALTSSASVRHGNGASPAVSQRGDAQAGTSLIVFWHPIRTHEGRTLTVKQARSLLDEVAEHRMGVLVLLALVFGLRRGETLGLMWSGFDPAGRTLRVTHA